MSPENVLEELTTILRDALGNDTIVLSMDTVRSDVNNWDSFNYITFMVAVESKFKIKFRTADIEAFANVGEIVQKILELEQSS
jgi:acyl carrier protein